MPSSADVEMKDGATADAQRPATDGHATSGAHSSGASSAAAASPMSIDASMPSVASPSESGSGASSPSAELTTGDAFVSFPPPIFASSPHRTEVSRTLRLPPKWLEGAGPASRATGKGAASGGSASSKKAKGDDGKSIQSSPVKDHASGASSKEKEKADAEKERKRREKEKERAKEKEKIEKLVPEAGCTLAESFERLVQEILKEGKPSAAVPSHASSSSLSPSAAAAADALAVHRSWEVPYLAHFTWLFQKPLMMRPLDPSRIEQILLAPNHILNEALFSEFASKLLFATRLTFHAHYKRALAYMGRNQRCCQYEWISEWMHWIIEVWIEQWKQHTKAVDGDESGDEEDAEEDGEEATTSSSRTKRAGSRRGRKTPATEAASDSDLEAEENEEEKEAYNLHQVPERKWCVDTEALFGNVNPFAGDVPESATTADATESKEASRSSTTAAADASADSASAAAAAASSTADSVASPAPPAVVLPVRRKSFHELSLTHRVTILKLLCDYQLHVNPSFIAQLRSNDAKGLQVDPVGSDCTGKRYFFFGFADYRIYVQGTPEYTRTPKSLEEEARDAAEKATFQRDVAAEVARLRLKAAEQDHAAKEKADAAAKEKKDKKDKKRAMKMSEDAPLSMLLAPASSPSKKIAPIQVATSNTKPPPENHALAYWSASPAQTTPSSAASQTPAPTATINTPTAAAAASVAPPSLATPHESVKPEPAPMTDTTTATVAATNAPPVNSPGLPFALLSSSTTFEPPRVIELQVPAAPSFSLLTTSAAQMRALIARVASVDHPRNAQLATKLREILGDLSEGRGRRTEEEEKKGKKDVVAPKRVSDRLVTLEAAREEVERARLVRAEEESRSRYTRRNRWVDQMTQRNIGKVRRSYEKLMGIEHERRTKETASSSASDQEEEEDSDSETDDESHGRRSRKRKATDSRSGSTTRNTRNRGVARKNLAEPSDTETEGDDEDVAAEPVVDSDDEGCAVCGTVIPPEDGSNPILLCDHCDKQLCLHCIPLDRVPHGKFFCNECVIKNPRIR